jgi:hypothetical protein
MTSTTSPPEPAVSTSSPRRPRRRPLPRKPIRHSGHSRAGGARRHVSSWTRSSWTSTRKPPDPWPLSPARAASSPTAPPRHGTRCRPGGRPGRRPTPTPPARTTTRAGSGTSPTPHSSRPRAGTCSGSSSDTGVRTPWTPTSSCTPKPARTTHPGPRRPSPPGRHGAGGRQRGALRRGHRPTREHGRHRGLRAARAVVRRASPQGAAVSLVVVPGRRTRRDPAPDRPAARQLLSARRSRRALS